jgi:peptidoglycan/LPS O-acetylase OafA/YrhL
MKPHYPILDGLRGVAAILVVVFHILEAHFPVYAQHPVHHGYLAVDFFFLLSGFVIGYAYDDRWGSMSTWDFFKIRLVRLHPLVLLGTVVGAIGFVLDSYTNGMAHTSWLKLVGVMLISFTLLPAPDVRGWGETHSLDGPCWSLLQEYIANVLYAFIGRRLGLRALGLVVAASAVALTWAATHRGDIATGWGYDSFGYAIIRMMYPFFAGLLLFRAGRLLRLPFAFPLCSLLLAILFCLPTFTHNGLYEAACIILAFPLLVAAGAGSQLSGIWTRVSKYLGDISYPLYITHYALIYPYTAWVTNQKPTWQQALPVAIGLFVAAILLAYAALKLYDEPVREWLKKHVLMKRVPLVRV